MLACATVVMMATASAPSPIYPLYRERWGLSVTMLTVIFAVYVVGLLGALLTVGSLSDQLGRRPVLVAALLVAATSTAVFWTADGVVSLLIARVVQGIATGTATGALAAGLVELSPKRHPQLGPTTTAVGTSIGMAAGAGVVGLLVQSTSRPDAYVFPVLMLTFVVLAAVVLTIPETLAPHATGLASLRPSVRVPREARPEFFASVPALVAGWSVTGLFLALTPSLVSNVLHVRSGAAGGLSIAALFLANSVGGLWSVRHTARLATLLGAVLLALGASGLAVAIAVASCGHIRGRIGHCGAGRRPDVQRQPPRHQRGHHREVAVGGLLGRLRDQLCGVESSGPRGRARGALMGAGDHGLSVRRLRRGAVLGCSPARRTITCSQAQRRSDTHGLGKRTSQRTVPLLSTPYVPRRHHPRSSLIRTYGCRVGAGRLASAELSSKILRSK